ncbi:MAG: rod shape-determining protein MreC [Patescibacteria group bacterium]|nr:rod shape-determining protein MreC [Patescibacteria group bacterium]
MITRSGRKLLSKVLLGGLFVIFIIVLNSKGLLNPFKYLISNTTTVGFGSVREKTINTQNFLGAIFSIGKIKKENERLKELELELSIATQEKKELEEENIELREQFKLLPKDKYKLMGATVVAQDPDSPQEFIRINKGEKDGVKRGMPVIIYDKILVGEVYEAQPHRSKILLSVSSLNTYGVAPATAKIVGVAKGQYNLEILFDFIPHQTELNLDELVITAGKNQKYPEGLLVGKIIEIGQSADGLFKQAVVKPFYSANDLKFVFLITE